MISLKQLRYSYIENNTPNNAEQLIYLDSFHERFGDEDSNFVLINVQSPEKEDYSFFKENYGYLIPLFIEKNTNFKDVYCINIENSEQYKISVFAQDGIVHDWDNFNDFNDWLIRESGYLLMK